MKGKIKNSMARGRYTFSIPNRVYQRLKLRAADFEGGTMSGVLSNVLSVSLRRYPPQVEAILSGAGVDINGFYNDADLFNDVINHLQSDSGFSNVVEVFKDRLPMKPKTGGDNGQETQEK